MLFYFMRFMTIRVGIFSGVIMVNKKINRREIDNNPNYCLWFSTNNIQISINLDKYLSLREWQGYLRPFKKGLLTKYNKNADIEWK